MTKNRKLKEHIHKAVKTVSTDSLWSLDISKFPKPIKHAIKIIKLIRITFYTFAENRMGFQCVALSYFGALATVPFLAFIFFIGKGFRISDKLSSILYDLIPAAPEMINVLLEKADNIIDTAQSGTVGAVGAATFLFTILWLMFQIERVFNNVWGIRKIPRKLYKRFSFYILALLMSPFIVLLFSTGIAFYTNATSIIGLNLHIDDLKVLPVIAGWGVFCLLSAGALSLMYKFIPSPKVIYACALKAAVVAAPIFTVFQYLYLETQIFVSRINGVYGVLAAIPLFLIWMNFSWQIIIYGAELAYAFQHVDTYNLEDNKTTHKRNINRNGY